MEQNLSKVVAVFALMLVSSFVMAETMIFDTVTSYKSGKSNFPSSRRNMSITGIEKETGDTITAVFGYTSSNGKDANTICTPSVITAMEKPGRYYLHVSWDNIDEYSSSSNVDQVRYCMLELKTIPQ